ncbi:MAG: hypothetical protein QNJ38_13935 [Prochloraceae cyanobacterium]|nr:hypothetical protein [Prochloraceae cyanobacterium]
MDNNNPSNSLALEYSRSTIDPEERFARLEEIVEYMGEAIIATTDTVENLAHRVDNLALLLEEQAEQVQQQGYQVFALNDAIETLVQSQSDSQAQIEQLTEALHSFVIAVNSANSHKSS